MLLRPHMERFDWEAQQDPCASYIAKNPQLAIRKVAAILSHVFATSILTR